MAIYNVAVILFLSRKYPPSVGGMQRAIFSLATSIARRRDTHVIAWGGSQWLLPVFVPRALVSSLVIGLRGKVDVIHVGDAAMAPLGILLKGLLGAPLVVTVHGLDVTYANRAYQMSIPACLRRSDSVVAVSRNTLQELILRGVPSDRCRVITNGIDPTIPFVMERAEAIRYLERTIGQPLANSRIILTTGRLVSRKGVSWFVDSVMPGLAAVQPDLIYLVVGEGAERERIAHRIRERALVGRVELLGQVDEATLWAAYQAADLFVMPNIPVHGDVEGFGLVALEACLAGRCVVAADLEGLRDAICDGENGFLVPPEDSSAFVHLILALLGDDEKRSTVGNRARSDVVDRFGWPRIADEYLSIYRDLTSKELRT